MACVTITSVGSFFCIHDRPPKRHHAAIIRDDGRNVSVMLITPLVIRPPSRCHVQIRVSNYSRYFQSIIFRCRLQFRKRVSLNVYTVHDEVRFVMYTANISTRKTTISLAKRLDRLAVDQNINFMYNIKYI